MHICCPVCFEATPIDAEQLWKTYSDENRLLRKSFEHCKTQIRLGSWLHSITHHLPLRTRLRNRDFYNPNTKPLHVTPKLSLPLLDVRTDFVGSNMFRNATIRNTYHPKIYGAHMVNIVMEISSVAIL